MPTKQLPEPADSATKAPASVSALVEFRSNKTRGQWEQVNDDSDETAGAVVKLRAYVSEMLTAENLVVMAGLGTSVCIKDSAAKPLAPTMGHL